jgi:hypothetical protein
MFKIHPVIGYKIHASGVVSKIRGNGDKIPFLTRSGYHQISAKGKTWFVHRLVWEAFNGEIPKGFQINHIDGVKSNNCLSNLELVTPLENIQHAFALGLKSGSPGETNSMAKLTDTEYLELMDEIVNGATNDEIAIKYNLHSRYVSLIRHQKRLKTLWKHYFDANPNAVIKNSSGLQSKIDIDTRIKIIQLLDTHTNKELGQQINVDPSVISNVRHKKSWLDAWAVIESERSTASRKT